MNDEIKEILNKIENVVNHKEASYNALVETKAEDYKKLLDYITTLEQAVKDTKDSADDMLYELKQELEEEKRIEEADLKTIQRLEEENEELKSKLECYENGVYYSSKVDELEQENERLKEEKDNLYLDNTMIKLEKDIYKQGYGDFKNLINKLQNGSDNNE